MTRSRHVSPAVVLADGPELREGANMELVPGGTLSTATPEEGRQLAVILRP